MTYHFTNVGRPVYMPTRVARARPASMGGIFDDIAAAIIGAPALIVGDVSGIGGQSGDQTACIAQANTQTASLDAKIANLASTWNPSGYYTPDQMSQVVTQTLALLSSAIDQVNAAPNSTSDSQMALANELDLLGQRSTEGTVFIASAAQAKTQGVNLDSPGLKSWVIRAMQQASNSLVTAYTLECALGPLGQAVQVVEAAADTLISYLKTVAGVIATLAQDALKVPDKVATLASYLMYGSIAVGALYLYLKFGKNFQRPSATPRLSARRTTRRSARRSTRRRSNRRSRR